MLIEPEVTQLSVVLLGNFNPTIFQPAWLARHGVITEKAAETAAITVIHPDVVIFAVQDLFTLHVERERFSISRASIPWVFVSDFVAKIFGDLLPHTPVSKLGINLVVHFDAGSQAKRDEIGERLAPPAPWGEWGALAASGEGMRRGGLRSLTMIQKNVSDRPAGWVQAKIEPSILVRGGVTGIFMEINDHYELVGQSEDARAIVAILQEKFDSSVRNSERIVDQIMSMVK
jgi:hypothetical protein